MKSSKITYHKVTADDIQSLVQGRIQFALEFSGEISPKQVEELKAQLEDYFIRATGNGNCISYLAKCGDQIAGIGSMMLREQPGNFKNPSGKWAYIMNMYTYPSFRRLGICTGILKALTDEASLNNITAIELHATKNGELVYVQNGFVIHNEPTYRKFI